MSRGLDAGKSATWAACGTTCIRATVNQEVQNGATGKGGILGQVGEGSIPLTAEVAEVVQIQEGHQGRRHSTEKGRDGRRSNL